MAAFQWVTPSVTVAHDKQRGFAQYGPQGRSACPARLPVLRREDPNKHNSHSTDPSGSKLQSEKADSCVFDEPGMQLEYGASRSRKPRVYHGNASLALLLGPGASLQSIGARPIFLLSRSSSGGQFCTGSLRRRRDCMTRSLG